MIVGIGIDVLEHAEIDGLAGGWDNEFFRHTFSVAEQDEARSTANPLAYFAGRFCAKEALIKALDGWGESARMRDIETVKGPSGAPHIHLIGELADVLPAEVRLHVSITHTRTSSTALVIAERP